MWDMKEGLCAEYYYQKDCGNGMGSKLLSFTTFFSNGKHSSGIAKTIKHKILSIMVIWNEGIGAEWYY